MSPDPSRLAAALLLEAGAVAFDPGTGFVHASGRRAPTYVDCRRPIGFPRIRAALADLLARRLLERAGAEAFDVIAGGETAGIPYAALLADRLALPMAYVRKTAKGHGRMARIEGRLRPGDRVLLVEDLATDGGSKLSFVEAIREAGGECRHAAVVFAYGIFPALEDRLSAAGVALHALCTWRDVLEEARARRAFEPAVLEALAAYLADPEGWTPAAG